MRPSSLALMGQKESTTLKLQRMRRAMEESGPAATSLIESLDLTPHSHEKSTFREQIIALNESMSPIQIATEDELTMMKQMETQRFF